VLSEYIIEYKLTKDVNEKPKKLSAENAIQQIFDQQYYNEFEGNRNLFVIGIGFNSFSEKVITEILIKKFHGNNRENFRDPKAWKVIIDSSE